MTKMTAPWTGIAALAALCLALAGCGSSRNSEVKIVDGASSSQSAPQPVRVLGSEEIRSVLIGKTWQYTATGLSGFVTYNEDGSLSYQDDAKGQGTGTWSAVEGQLCQSIAGNPTECGEFKSTGDAYHAGKMRLVGA